MFLYIIALKTRLMKWPVASILLLIVTLALSLFESSHKSLHSESVKKIATESRVWTARIALVQQLCSGNHLPQQCQALQQLKPQDFANIQTFLNMYKRTYPDDNGREFKKWSKWLVREDLHRNLADDVKNHPVVAEYEKVLKKHRLLLAADAKTNTKLMRGNIRFAPAVKALFLHEGWLDLISSLAVFALFAAFLEQRVGPAGIVVIYILGGAGGNFLQSAYLSFGSYLAGSGAAVSAILGAFLVFFYQEKSYCGVNLGDLYRKTIVFPAWAYVLFFFGLNAGLSWLGGSNLNYLAYSAGLALGAIIASMHNDLFPLKKTFLFPHEQAMYYEAKKNAKFDGKLELFQKIYHLNRESFYAYRTLFAYFEKHQLSLNSFKVEDRELVTNILLECFRYHGKNEKSAYSQQVLGLVPLRWNLNTVELTVTADEIIDRANQFQAQGALVQGLRYYDLFLEKYAAHPRAEQAHAVIMRMFDELERFDREIRVEMLDILLAYQEAHPTTHFHSQIRRILQQVESESGRAA